MNIYLISQTENNDYDTFDSAVVAAPSEESAKRIHPFSTSPYAEEESKEWNSSAWASKPENVTAKMIGTTDLPAGLILASFNAG